MIVDPAVVGLVRDFVGIFGWASIISGGIWALKEYLAFKSDNKQTLEAALSSTTQIAAVKLAVDTMQTNHMKHLQDDVTEIQTTMGTHFADFVRINDRQLDVLRNIDKGIGILVDRGDRQRISVTVDHPEA